MTASSARFAAPMLSPPIDPEQSSTTFSATGRAGACIISGARLTIATYSASSRATTACARVAAPLISSTKSRSSVAPFARPSRVPVSVRATVTA